MKPHVSILIKLIIAVKSVFISLIFISIIMLSSELWAVRNQLEGMELLDAQPEKLLFLIVVFLALMSTLLFDLKTVKQKEIRNYKNWAVMLLLTISTIIISSIVRIQWLGMSLMSLLGFYAIYLFLKLPANTIKR